MLSQQDTTSSATERIERAYQEWRSRQDRRHHPAGNFDGKGRRYPAASEKCPCCDEIRSPSANYPFSLMTHCRSAEHVAALHCVPARDLRSRIAKDRQDALREGGDEYYKAVAVRDDCYYSIFDGATEYVLGEPVTDRARQVHGGGIYVYGTEQEARRAEVPCSSELLCVPRAILRVRAEGAYCRYDNGKLAFSRATPLAVCH